MSNQFDLLVDSDVFVGWILPNDALSQKIKRIFHNLKAQQKQWVTTNWVVAETATVLSHRDSQQTAVNFLTMIEEGGITVLTVTPELEQATYQVFREQSIKNISMTDCSNVAMAQHYQIPRLLTFDHFYTRYGYEVQRVDKVV